MLIPLRLIRVSLLSLALWCLKPSPTLAFSDTNSHWANQCIDQLASQKLVSGYPDNTFRPQNTLTRAEFAVLMLNAFPQTEPTRQASRFNDVPSTHWAARAIRDAYEREFFSGYPNNQFQPNQAIPRVQAIAILSNAAKMSQPDPPEAVLQRFYDDAGQVPTYARKAVAAGTIGRIVTNYPNLQQLRPNQSTTRGEVAALLCQTLRLARTLPQNYIVGGNDFFLFPPEMGGISKFSEELAVVKVNNQYGYMDTYGTVVIPAQFDEAHTFSEGLAAVRLGEKWGYINRQGQFVIPAQFQGFPSKFSEGLATIQLASGETGVIDQKGKWIIAPQFNLIRDFSEGLAAISVSGKYGYFDKTGKIVIEPQFEEAGAFSQGLAPVDLTGNQWGYINSNGKVIIPGQFSAPSDFWGTVVTPFSTDGVAMARVGEKVGFINPQGQWIIQPTFADVNDFNDGFARVNLGGTWVREVIDRTHHEGSIYATRLYGGAWGYIRVAPLSP